MIRTADELKQLSYSTPTSTISGAQPAVYRGAIAAGEQEKGYFVPTQTETPRQTQLPREIPTSTIAAPAETEKRDAAASEIPTEKIEEPTVNVPRTPQERQALGAAAAGVSTGAQTAATAIDEGINWKSLAQDVSGIGKGVVSSLAQQYADRAEQEYNKNMADWEAQGKYWFDPNRDLKPDIEAYLNEMPTQTEMLSKGNKADSPVVAAIDPASYIAQQAGGNKAGYIARQGAKGALKYMGSGGSYGWIGAIVGGAVGIVEGVLGWSNAESADKEMRKRTLTEYERKLKEWTMKRNTRIANQMIQVAQNKGVKDALRAGIEKEKKAKKKLNRNQSIAAKRTAVAQALFQGGAASAKNRAKRAAMWGRA